MTEFWEIGQNYYFHMDTQSTSAPTGAWYYGTVVATDEYGVIIDHSSYSTTYNTGFDKTPPVVTPPLVRFNPEHKQWWNRNKIIWAIKVPTLP